MQVVGAVAGTLLAQGCKTPSVYIKQDGTYHTEKHAPIAQPEAPPLEAMSASVFEHFKDRMAAVVTQPDMFTKVLSQYLPEGLEIEDYVEHFAEVFANANYDPAIVWPIKNSERPVDQALKLDIGSHVTQKSTEELQKLASLLPHDDEYKYANTVIVGNPQRTGFVSGTLHYTDDADAYGLIKVTPTTETFKGERVYNVSISSGPVEALENLVEENLSLWEKTKGVTRDITPTTATSTFYGALENFTFGGFIIGAAAGLVGTLYDYTVKLITDAEKLPVYVETDLNMSTDKGISLEALKDFRRFHFKTSEKKWNINYDHFLLTPDKKTVVKVDKQLEKLNVSKEGIVEIVTKVTESYLKDMFGGTLRGIAVGLPIYLGYKYKVKKEREEAQNQEKCQKCQDKGEPPAQEPEGGIEGEGPGGNKPGGEQPPGQNPPSNPINPPTPEQPVTFDPPVSGPGGTKPANPGSPIQQNPAGTTGNTGSSGAVVKGNPGGTTTTIQQSTAAPVTANPGGNAASQGTSQSGSQGQILQSGAGATSQQTGTVSSQPAASSSPPPPSSSPPPSSGVSGTIIQQGP